MAATFRRLEQELSAVWSLLRMERNDNKRLRTLLGEAAAKLSYSAYASDLALAAECEKAASTGEQAQDRKP